MRRNPFNDVVMALLLFTGVASAENRLSLETCKKLAIKNNVSMKNSGLENESAEKIKEAAFTKYFPQVNAGAIAFKNRDPFIRESIAGGNLPVYDGAPANLFNASQYAYFPGLDIDLLEKGQVGYVALVQPLFAGGRIVNGNRLADLGREVSILQQKMTEEEVRLSAEEQYFRVVSLDEKRKTVLRYETLLVTLLRQVEDAFKTGISLKNDVLKVRQKKSEVELNRSRIENGRELAFMSFCQYIGIAYDPSIILTGRVIITDTPETFRVKNEKEAVASRTESHLLQKSVAAEALKTQIKRGEYMPEVSVGMASLYTQFDDRKHDDNGMVFATAAIPLSGWWEASYTMKERALREKMETNRQKETTDLLLLQIKKAWKDVEEAFKQVGLCETSRTQAEENLSLSKDSYVNGIVDIADLLEAQAIFQKSEEELIEAKVNYRIKKILYLKTTGQRF